MRHYIPVPGTLFRRWRHYRKIHWELSQFNDRQLLDLGIRRNDINHVARAAAVEAVLDSRECSEAETRPTRHIAKHV
jgi:uncharacterized protein YjiS (DUF1127 family)